MRSIDCPAPHPLQQALVFSGGLLRTVFCRHTRHATHIAGRARRMYRPEHLPLYVVAGVVGLAVLLLVVTAWLRVMMPVSFGRGMRW